MKQNNFKNFLKGTLTIFGIFSLIGVVFAVGFHSADEILGGIFSGDYKFTGNLQLNNSNSVCDSSNEGGLKVLNGNLNLCDGTVWNIINNSDDNQGETVLLLHFDGDYLDSSNSAHTVSTIGSPTVSSTGKFGNAMYISGYGSYIQIPTDSDFVFGDEDFTIDFWLKFSSVTTNSQTIFDQGNDGGGSDGMRFLRYYSTSGSWQFTFGDVSETKVNLFSSADSLENNVWYHFAVIRNGNF